VFVHISELQRTKLHVLHEGQAVVFDLVEHAKGPRAANVQLA